MLIFLTLNPLAVFASFTSLTVELTRAQKRSLANKSLLFATCVLLIIAVGGLALLKFLGLETFSLQIAGGVLFVKFGWDTLGAPRNDLKIESPFVPLGFPIIAGPGSITAVIVLANSVSFIEILLALALSLLFTALLLHFSDNIYSSVGEDMTKSLLKIMGVFIITLGIQLVLSGIGLWITSGVFST